MRQNEARIKCKLNFGKNSIINYDAKNVHESVRFEIKLAEIKSKNKLKPHRKN